MLEFSKLLIGFLPSEKKRCRFGVKRLRNEYGWLELEDRILAASTKGEHGLQRLCILRTNDASNIKRRNQGRRR
jgi:hypothetical protein